MHSSTTAVPQGGRGVAINGPVLRALRTIHGYSAVELAQAIRRHPSFISKLETGAAQRVSPSVFRRLLDVLSIDNPAVLLRPCAPHDGDEGDEPTERASA